MIYTSSSSSNNNSSSSSNNNSSSISSTSSNNATRCYAYAYTADSDTGSSNGVKDLFNKSGNFVLYIVYYNHCFLELCSNLAIKAKGKPHDFSCYSFLIYLTTATTTTTTTTSITNPTTTITATRSSDISFDSPFKGLSSS
ncbi:hypothetical protein P8C59_003697 [Phyllachora maydis]|uniref:Uncharacterized protein n=1 Tax=Phyllachora maydis TaxID=1825666 RepID=A0AAD9MBP3_9PEZI|nr:hypothetical protein P8C59_003697 [Phyllachora maydis]